MLFAQCCRGTAKRAGTKLIKLHRFFRQRRQVNKIREVPGFESIIVTHTDAPELYVWSLERQPDRAQDRVRPQFN